MADDPNVTPPNPHLTRHQANRLSVLALHELLQDIIRSPSGFSGNESLKNALRSQGALSKWSSQEKKIVGSSLNTLKRIADKVLDGGFEAIDQARIGALEAMRVAENREKHSSKSTKAGLQIRITDKDAEHQQALQDLWHVTSALSKALIQWRRCAEQSGSPSAIALCEREQKEIRARISLCNLPVAKNDLPQDATA